jgi:hypothetical protein
MGAPGRLVEIVLRGDFFLDVFDDRDGADDGVFLSLAFEGLAQNPDGG